MGRAKRGYYGRLRRRRPLWERLYAGNTDGRWIPLRRSKYVLAQVFGTYSGVRFVANKEAQSD